MLLVVGLSTSYECFVLQIYFRSISTKERKYHYKVRHLFWITKRGKVVLLHIGATFITNWDNNYKVMQCRRQMKETGEIDFGNVLLYSTLICQVTDFYPDRNYWEVDKFCYNQKKRNHTFTTNLSVWLVSLRNIYLEVFLVLKIIKILQNLYLLRRLISITLQVQLYLNHSPQWIFFSQLILWEFRNIFLKEHLWKAFVATCTSFNVMTLHSSSHQRCSLKMAILKNSAIFAGKHLCWNLFLIKLQA